jgi:prepilin-type N-terminal cleavage/methylation domain-containing protein
VLHLKKGVKSMASDVRGEEVLARMSRVKGADMKSRSGLTLIEVIIAIAIFAVFVGGACAVVIAARQLNELARDRYIAVNLAKNRLERARTFPFDQLSSFDESNVQIDSVGDPSNNGNYRRSTTVSNVSASLIEMSVAVEIRDRKTLQFEGQAETVSSMFADGMEVGE